MSLPTRLALSFAAQAKYAGLAGLSARSVLPRLWWERNFYRDVWDRAQEAWAGIDPADLAAVAGHTVETATARYTHALGRSDDALDR